MSAPWRNGSASDSRSEGCVFKSRRGQYFSFLFLLPLVTLNQFKLLFLYFFFFFQTNLLVTAIRSFSLTNKKIIMKYFCSVQSFFISTNLSNKILYLQHIYTTEKGTYNKNENNVVTCKKSIIYSS